MEILKEEKLYVKFKKCEFWSERVVFLEYVITTLGKEIDPRKVEAILNWSRPISLRKIHSFLGLAGQLTQLTQVQD